MTVSSSTPSFFLSVRVSFRKEHLDILERSFRHDTIAGSDYQSAIGSVKQIDQFPYSVPDLFDAPLRRCDSSRSSNNSRSVSELEEVILSHVKHGQRSESQNRDTLEESREQNKLSSPSSRTSMSIPRRAYKTLTPGGGSDLLTEGKAHGRAS